MAGRYVHAALAVALFATATAALAQQDAGQVGMPPAPPAGWQAPKTPWGDPDMRGTYPLEAMGRTPMQRNPRYGERKLLTEEEFAEADEAARELEALDDKEDQAGTLGSGLWSEFGVPLRQSSLIVEPANGRIPPLTSAGEVRRDTMRDSWNGTVFDSTADFNSLDLCLSRGMPASMVPFPYNNGLRIFQAPGLVVIQLEMIHEARVIHLDDGAPPPASVTSYLGYSRGHWDGDTLVVETTNFNGKTPMVIVGPGNAPIPTSEAMTVTEHFTLTGPEQVYYEAWVRDPVVLTGPFKMGFPWTRDDEYELFEYACHEGNSIVRNYIHATSPRFAQWRAENGGTAEVAQSN